jgi:hypothetical protein
MSNLNSLYIASSGYLNNCNETLMPTVDGYWYTCGENQINPEFRQNFIKKSSGNEVVTKVNKINYKDPTLDQTKLNNIILQEEEELLNFIKIFMKCL